jgi:hypothetical protein
VFISFVLVGIEKYMANHATNIQQLSICEYIQSVPVVNTVSIKYYLQSLNTFKTMNASCISNRPYFLPLSARCDFFALPTTALGNDK